MSEIDAPFERSGDLQDALAERCMLAPRPGSVQAREQIVADLRDANLLIDERRTEQTVRVHERCGTPLEILETNQWYISVLDAKDALLEAGRKIAWRPAHMQARYEHWVANLSWDWCISRQRFYGVPFPVWHCDSCGAMILADEAQLPAYAVLYEDADVLVVDKPAGLLSAPTPESDRANLLTLLRGRRDTRVFLVHRLDLPTSGVLVFACTAAANRALAAAFARHDVETGERLYRSRIAPGASAFTASPWAYNGKIFALSEEGDTYVIEAGKEFRLLGVNSLNDWAMASPAIVGERLLIRTRSRLYSIRKGR